MATSRNRKHGGKGTREYRAWSHMKGRCYCVTDEKFALYGGRGIVVCARWLHSFENFLADMGLCPAGLTLDRKDSNGNYEPENCRWATHLEQGRNTSRNRPLAAFGRTQLLCDWAREFGLSDSRIHYALKRGELLEPYLRKVIPNAA